MAKNSKYRKVVKNNRGNTLIMTCHFADETPDGLWDELYAYLKSIGIFDYCLKAFLPLYILTKNCPLLATISLF